MVSERETELILMVTSARWQHSENITTYLSGGAEKSQVKIKYHFSATVLLFYRFGMYTMEAGLFLRILVFLVNITSKWRIEEQNF